MVKLIKEFANSKTDEITKLQQVQDIIRDHLLCIYYWRDTPCVNHWMGEIVGFLPIMRKLKGTHKLLPEKLIYEYLFTDWADRFIYDVYAYVDKLMIKEHNLPEITDVDVNNVYNFLEEFYTTICHKLATDGSVLKSFLYTYIEKLLEKYPYTI